MTDPSLSTTAANATIAEQIKAFTTPEPPAESSPNARYFVRVDPQTGIVQNFYIIADGSPVEDPDFHAITLEEYKTFSAKKGAKWDNGTLSDYTPPPPPLRPQAQNALQAVQQKANMAAVMGEVFGPNMRAYVQALRAIADGSDTTSTQLPTAPDDVTT
ncbi:hypothetical protein [Saccharibacter floricola]|uniref:Uncharacterized protein n=1 Tax=Saccharibacter floricola DSM 15669 TaxID=1123227 RepID=A0ABQ0P081_9PROT|nr:hypothetical protein [Saccharibacter floricola]GBQ07986.1 hypothetical protein AA15669_1607 [Saccharibacter floricola DSM 15669]